VQEQYNNNSPRGELQNKYDVRYVISFTHLAHSCIAFEMLYSSSEQAILVIYFLLI